MGFFQQLFTWWNGATIGTYFYTSTRGRLVGADAAGNRYFEEKKPAPGRQPRRWVVYKGLAEASKVPSDWHGWLHHTFVQPPTAVPFKVKPWEKPHMPNLSGTPYAPRPPGSLYREAKRPHATGDYEPWQPDGT